MDKKETTFTILLFSAWPQPQAYKLQANIFTQSFILDVWLVF